MNKEQFDFIAFFLSCQLPIWEGRLEDIGTTRLLFTVDKLPSWWNILALKGLIKRAWKLLYIFKCIPQAKAISKIRFIGDIPTEY